MKNKIVLVAHGCRKEGEHSDKRICSIVKPHEVLTFDDAKDFFAINAPAKKFFVKFSSACLGDFEPLSSSDYKSLFDKDMPTPSISDPIVYTGLKRNRMEEEIYALTGKGMTFQDIVNYANSKDVDIILAACRA